MARLRKTLTLLVGLGLLAGVACEKKPGASGKGGKDKVATDGAAKDDAGGGSKSVAAKPRGVMGECTLKGVIKVEGNVPAPKELDMKSKPECDSLHPNDKPKTESLVVGAGNGLANAVVYVSDRLRGYKYKGEPAHIDQKGCLYVPHVFLIRTDQDLKITSSDPFLHNINSPGGGFNETQNQAGQETIKKTPYKKTGPTPLSCSVHSWMRAWAFVIDHPFAAVTDADGNFEIKGLPPGDYTLTVWHEFPKRMLKPPKDVAVTVAEGEKEKTVEFAAFKFQ